VCAFLHSYLIWKTEDSRLVSPAWVVCFFFFFFFFLPSIPCALWLWPRVFYEPDARREEEEI
jgi:hypothetical protein